MSEAMRERIKTMLTYLEKHFEEMGIHAFKTSSDMRSIRNGLHNIPDAQVEDIFKIAALQIAGIEQSKAKLRAEATSHEGRTQ